MAKSLIQQLLEDEFTCYAYSGRGMYGKTCLAVDQSLATVATTLIRAVGAYTPTTAEEVADDFEMARTDSMGLGQVTYFPGVEFVADDEDDHCDTCGESCPGKECCDDCAEEEVRP